MQKYVALTADHGPPGGPLLLSLYPPYSPLTANAINSITKTLLAQHGVPMSVYGAHSTRGAGVQYYKQLGLSSEQVAELGQWKNVAAFNAHYLRLNAAEVVQHKFLLPPVHNISPVEGAEPEGSCTPRKNDIGGSDPEGEAPKTGEPTLPPWVKSAKRKRSPKKFKSHKYIKLSSSGSASASPSLVFSFAKPPSLPESIGQFPANSGNQQ